MARMLMNSKVAIRLAGETRSFNTPCESFNHQSRGEKQWQMTE